MRDHNCVDQISLIVLTKMEKNVVLAIKDVNT